MNSFIRAVVFAIIIPAIYISCLLPAGGGERGGWGFLRNNLKSYETFVLKFVTLGFFLLGSPNFSFDSCEDGMERGEDGMERGEDGRDTKMGGNGRRYAKMGCKGGRG